MRSVRIDNRVSTLSVPNGQDLYNFPWFAILGDTDVHSKGRDNLMRLVVPEDGIAGTRLGPNNNGRKR
jgi:hypothetical protein